MKDGSVGCGGDATAVVGVAPSLLPTNCPTGGAGGAAMSSGDGDIRGGLGGLLAFLLLLAFWTKFVLGIVSSGRLALVSRT